jgi:arylsulfatase A-like enzyme
VTESKVPTWDPLLDPGPIKEKEFTDPAVIAAKGSPYGNDYFSGEGKIVTENMRGDDSRVIMDRVVPFVRLAVRKNTPFFAVVWFHTPHSPVVGGDKYRAMYSDRTENEQHYYACITAMDEQIGRLRAELKRLGVEDNTMLWFCSDNGAARQGSPRHVGSVGNLSGYKLSLQEGGIRVPGLLVWPEKVKKPFTVNAPCVTMDYFPTILDVLKINLPTDRVYDGISLVPLLEGKATKRKKAIGFLNRDAKESAWMEEHYKYLSTANKEGLFDIIKDPGETMDLSDSHPEIKRRMLEELNKWKTAVLDELEKVN